MNRRYFFRATLGSLVGLAAAPVLINLEKQRRIQPVQLDADKLDLVQRLLANAIETHGQLIEEAIFNGHQL